MFFGSNLTNEEEMKILNKIKQNDFLNFDQKCAHNKEKGPIKLFKQ
jgi:hypothetical protein